MIVATLALALSSSLAASSAPTPSGPFVGTHSETFETSTPGFVTCAPVFGGRGDLCQLAPSGASIGQTTFAGPCTVSPHGGGWLGGSVGAGVRITFDGRATAFGAYVATGPSSTIEASFYGDDGLLLGSVAVAQSAQCSWVWIGASAASGHPFQSVELRHAGGAFPLSIDDLQAIIDGASTWPAPATYCTAKTSSGGCTPVLSTTYTGTAPAVPKMGYPDGFFSIVASQVEPNRNGLFFYGASGAQAVPFSCSGMLCVKPPTKRTPVLDSGGAAACSGVLKLSWNPWILSGQGAGGPGDPFAPGQPIWMQAWFRDPPACGQSGLTDAVAFVMQ